MNVRALVLAAVLLPVLGFAQTFTVRTVPAPGESVARVVMQDASELTVEVTNTSNANLDSRLSDVYLILPDGYQLLGGIASPETPDWVVTFLDANSRRIHFQSTTDCSMGLQGLTRGQSARFILNVVGPSSSTADVTGERLSTQTAGRDQCDGTDFTATVTNATWTRSILASTVTATPRALAVNGTLTSRVVVENRGTGSGTVTLDNPTTTNAAVPLTNATKDGNKTVATRAAGVFLATQRPTAAGATSLRVRARVGTASNAPLADSPGVDVGGLAAAADVGIVDAFTGEQVTVRLTVLNTTSASSYTNVRPRAPVLVGNATAALVSGPTPDTVATLAPGGSTQFIWRYLVSGLPGASYQFQVQTDAMLSGTAVVGDVVTTRKGRIVEHRVRMSPDTVSPAATNVTVGYTVQNRGFLPIIVVKLFKPAVNYFSVAASGPQAFGDWIVSSDASGYYWESDTGIPPGGEATFRITYTGFSATNVLADTGFRHRLELNQGYNDPRIRVEGTLTLSPVSAAPEVSRLTGVARDASVTLTWDNPFNHGGTLVLRAPGTTAPNALPVSGTAYAVGDVLGNATVVYKDELSSASSFTDGTVTNGTTYTYRVHNVDDERRYSVGNQPTSEGLVATPRPRTQGNPLWCYSVGLSSLLQPITELGVGIYSSYNDSVVGVLTRPADPLLDGSERFRPVKLSGLVGSRFPVVPLLGRGGQQFLVVGDQSGVPAVLDAATGVALWRNTALALGNISSFPVTQLLDYANPAFRLRYSNVDLAMFATRVSSAANNQVVALNAATGALIWRYRPGNLGMVSGGMLVDYTTNRLYVGAKTGVGSTDTLRVIDTLTGQEVNRKALGDLEFGVVRNATSNQILVTSGDGAVYGLDPSTLATLWTQPIAARPTSFVRPLGRGFVVSLANGRVERYEVSASNVVTQLWSVPIANPSGTFSLNQSGIARIYVGSSDGKVHQLELDTGVDSAQVSVVGSAQDIGTPTIDSGVGRLHVGTSDGRICALPVPFVTAAP